MLLVIGVSFHKGLGAVHGLSEPIGATFNTQHGLTNAVILPWVLRDLQTMAAKNAKGFPFTLSPYSGIKGSFVQ